MSWPNLIGTANTVLRDSLGEPLTIRAVDGSETASLLSLYDRRSFEAEINGSKVIDADFRIAVLEAELPQWVAPEIDGQGVDVDILADQLRVTELMPDGQGIVALVCQGR